MTIGLLSVGMEPCFNCTVLQGWRGQDVKLQKACRMRASMEQTVLSDEEQFLAWSVNNGELIHRPGVS